jgi:hypothetical protein
MKWRIALLMVPLLPSVAFAQQANPDFRDVIAIASICPLLALLVGLLVFLFFVIRRTRMMSHGAYLELATKHIELANAHMAAQAERETRIIELLESIERELKRNEHSEGIKKV